MGNYFSSFMSGVYLHKYPAAITNFMLPLFRFVEDVFLQQK